MSKAFDYLFQVNFMDVPLRGNVFCFCFLGDEEVRQPKFSTGFSDFATEFFSVPPDILVICRALFEEGSLEGIFTKHRETIRSSIDQITGESAKEKSASNRGGNKWGGEDFEPMAGFVKRHRPPWMQTLKQCKEKLYVVSSTV